MIGRGIRVVQAFVCQLFDKHSRDVQAELYLNPCIICDFLISFPPVTLSTPETPYYLLAHTCGARCQLLVPSVIGEEVSKAQCDASSHCVEAVSTASPLKPARPQFASLCCSADERAAGLD